MCFLSSGRTAGGEADSQGSSALMSLQNFFLHCTLHLEIIVGIN